MIATEYCKKVFDGTHDSPKPVENGRLLITSKHIANRSLDISSAYLISEEDFENVNKRSQVHQWDILFSMIGTVGNVYIETSEKIDYAIKNMGVFSCQNKEKAYWLYYYLQSPLVQAKIDALMAGAVQKFVPLGFLRDLDIPEYTENSKKVVQVLSALDDKIALNKKMNQKLEAMAKRLYDYWFVQYDFPDKNGHPYKTTGGPMTYNETLKREIPEGWEVKKVSDYADLITKGTTPSTLGFDFQDTGINFVKVECIENGQILQENLMHISEEANVAMKRSQLRSNDILVTIAGRLGSAAIVSEHILPANTNQAVALIRMKKEYGHLVNYIYRVISSSSMQKRLQGSNAQSIQKNLTLPILGDIEFVQDSNCEIIKRFNEITKPIFLRQQENIQEITRLTALRDKLLPLLMNGQVVVG